MSKKKKVIIAVITALAALIAGVFVWQTYNRVSQAFKSIGAPSPASFKSPVEDLPQTNPFERVETNPLEKVKTNPFQDVYKNPFGE